VEREMTLGLENPSQILRAVDVGSSILVVAMVELLVVASWGNKAQGHRHSGAGWRERKRPHIAGISCK